MQVAFERELASELTPLSVQGFPALLIARQQSRVRVTDATCPHRGAHLAHGGRLHGDAVICPFHGKRVSLTPGSDGLCVRAHRAFSLNGMVFAALSPQSHHAEVDLEAHLHALDADHYFVPGFSAEFAVDAAWVTENAFDADHFAPVHGLREPPRLEVCSTRDVLTVRGEFLLPPSEWHIPRPGESEIRVPYEARAFSPYLVLSNVGGARPYTVLTSALPLGPKRCRVRLSVLLPARSDTGAPTQQQCRMLLEQMRKGLARDCTIWEHLEPTESALDLPGDTAVRAFRAFCEGFRCPSEGHAAV